MSPSFEITHQETTTTKVLRLNIFARVSKYAFEELRYQAKRTLTMFAPGSDPMIGIQNIFVRRADVLCRKDLVFWIKAPKSPPSPPKNLDSMEELRRDSSKAAQRKLRLLENARARSIRTHNAVCDFGWKRVYADAVSDVITQGMGDRAYRVHATYDAAQTWSSKLENDFRVCVQIDLNPDNAWECVQKGPSAEDKIASREFRSFWGKKSELRRFHDGTMLESVVWYVLTSTHSSQTNNLPTLKTHTQVLRRQRQELGLATPRPGDDRSTFNVETFSHESYLERYERVISILGKSPLGTI